MSKEIKRILGLVKEMREEEKKGFRTTRFDEIFYGEAIRGHKVFKCAECGEMVDYFGMEDWAADFEEGHYICCDCYANMLEDEFLVERD